MSDASATTAMQVDNARLRKEMLHTLVDMYAELRHLREDIEIMRNVTILKNELWHAQHHVARLSKCTQTDE